LRQIVRQMAVQIATEKSRGNTTVTVPVHPQFVESLRAARAAGTIGAEVFTGKLLEGPRCAGNQEGIGRQQIQEIRGPGRRQRAEEELPWRAQGTGRGRSLRRLH
jgi:hypothetical protein